MLLESQEFVKQIFTQVVGIELQKANAEVLAHELDHSTRRAWRRILLSKISPSLWIIARRAEEKRAYKAGGKYGKFFEDAIEVNLEALYNTLFPQGDMTTS